MSAPTQTCADSSFRHCGEVLGLAVREVFSKMVGVEVTIREGEPAPVAGDVTGMVGLAGQLCGVLTVRCTTNTATKIASQMLGVPIADAGAHTSDAIGEVCNMVAGSFKAKFLSLPDKCMLSLPTVIIGDAYHMHSLAAGERVELPFAYDGDLLWISLEIRS